MPPQSYGCCSGLRLVTPDCLRSHSRRQRNHRRPQRGSLDLRLPSGASAPGLFRKGSRSLWLTTARGTEPPQILREIAANWPALKPVALLGEGEGEFECPKKSALAPGVSPQAPGNCCCSPMPTVSHPPGWVRITASMFTDGGRPGCGVCEAAQDEVAAAPGTGPGQPRGQRPGRRQHREMASSAVLHGQEPRLPAVRLRRGGGVRLHRPSHRRGRRLLRPAGGPEPPTGEWCTAAIRRPWSRAVPGLNPGQDSCTRNCATPPRPDTTEGRRSCLGAAVYLFHLTLLWGVVQTFLFEKVPPAFPAVWGFRWLADFLLLRSFAPAAEDRRLIPFLPILEFLYIPYVLLFVPAGTAGWFRWREDEGEEEEEPPSS